MIAVWWIWADNSVLTAINMILYALVVLGKEGL